MRHISVRIVAVIVHRSCIGYRGDAVSRVGIFEIVQCQSVPGPHQGPEVSVRIVCQSLFRETVREGSGFVMPGIRQTGEAVIGECIGVFVPAGVLPSPFGDISRIGGRCGAHFRLVVTQSGREERLLSESAPLSGLPAQQVV